VAYKIQFPPVCNTLIRFSKIKSIYLFLSIPYSKAIEILKGAWFEVGLPEE
jgi:hypothetical protein